MSDCGVAVFHRNPECFKRAGACGAAEQAGGPADGQGRQGWRGAGAGHHMGAGVPRAKGGARKRRISVIGVRWRTVQAHHWAHRGRARGRRITLAHLAAHRGGGEGGTGGAQEARKTGGLPPVRRLCRAWDARIGGLGRVGGVPGRRGVERLHGRGVVVPG